MPRKWHPPPQRIAGLAANGSCFFESDSIMSESCPNCLDFSEVFAFFGEEGDASGDENSGQVMRSRECHHHGGESFVARGESENAFGDGEGTNDAAKNHCGIVAVWRGAEHSGGAIGATIAGGATERGERNATLLGYFVCSFLHKHSDFPMAVCYPSATGEPSPLQMPPWVERMRNSLRPSVFGFQPMPAFSVQPKRVPLGAERWNSASKGSSPLGPGPEVWSL